MTNEKKYTALELLCVLCWFLLDGFWLMEWKSMTYGFSGITIVFAGLMFRFIKREPLIIMVACADTSWLFCNISWAVGDMDHLKPVLNFAKVIFAVGLGFVLAAFIISDWRQKLSVLILSRLRNMKYFEK